MKLTTKRTITFLLLITVLANVLFFANPEKVNAQDATTVDIAKEWAKQLGYLAAGELTIRGICKGYAFTTEGLGSLKNRAVEWGKGKTFDKLWKKAKEKWGGAFEELFDSTVPVVDSAVEKATEKVSTKERVVTREEGCVTFLRDVVLATYKKRLLDYMTDQTVEWIQGGGDPMFITNPEKFYENAFQAAVGDMILQTKLAPICYESLKFKLQIQLMQPVFSQRVSCTLDKIVKNIGAFKNDFKTGGWIAYQESLKLQNTPAGISLLTQDELLRRQGKKSETAQFVATVGLGFLGDKRCNLWQATVDSAYLAPEFNEEGEIIGAEAGIDVKAGDTISQIGYGDFLFIYNKHSPDLKPYSGTTEQPSGSEWKCVQPETITPGRVAAESITKAIGSDFDFIINANDLSTYGAAIINALINRITKEGAQGLRYIAKGDKRTCEDFEENSWLRALCEEQGGSSENFMDIIVGSLDTQLEDSSVLLSLAEDNLETSNSTNAQLVGKLNQLITCQARTGVTFDEQASDKLAEAQTRTGTIEQLNVEAVAFGQELESLNQQLEEIDEDDIDTLQSDINDFENEVRTLFDETLTLEEDVQVLLTDAETNLGLCEEYIP